METFLIFRSSSSETWMWIADCGSWIVVIGVAAEVPEVLIKFGEALQDKKESLKILLGKWANRILSPTWLNRLGSGLYWVISRRAIIWSRKGASSSLHWCKRHSLLVESWGILWLMVVVLGLVIELGANQRARRIDGAKNALLHKEAGQAAKDAALANERTSRNELARTELEKQVNETKTQLANAQARLIEVQTENSPMDIGEQLSFAEALKVIPGMQVDLRSVSDSKAQRVAGELFVTFGWAGWKVISRSETRDFEDEGILIAFNSSDRHADFSRRGEPSNPNLSERAAYILLRMLTGRGVPARVDLPQQIRNVPTNTILVLVGPRPATPKMKLMLLEGREDELVEEQNKLGEQSVENRKRKSSTNPFDAEDMLILRQQTELYSEEEALRNEEQKLRPEVYKMPGGTNPGVHIYHWGSP